MPWQITDNQCDTPRFPVEKQKTINLRTTTRHSLSHTIMHWKRLCAMQTYIQWACCKVGKELGWSVSRQITKEWPWHSLKAPNLSLPAWVELLSWLHSRSRWQHRGKLCPLGDTDLFWGIFHLSSYQNGTIGDFGLLPHWNGRVAACKSNRSIHRSGMSHRDAGDAEQRFND